MEGFKYIPKRQRKDVKKQIRTLPPIEQIVQEKPLPIEAVEVEMAPEDRKMVDLHYKGGKPKTYRNITLPCSIEWSYGEDTSKAILYNTSSLEVVPEREGDSSCDRPSYRKKDPNETIFYQEKNLNEWTPRDIRIWRAENQVSLQCRLRINVPPTVRWNFLLPTELCDPLIQLHYEKPMPIQAQCLPLALDFADGGHDIIGLSQPGTGKTLAYAIPLIARVFTIIRSPRFSFDPRCGPLALVLVPTYELVDQVTNVIQSISAVLSISTGPLIGGTSVAEHSLSIEKRPMIMISTPGVMNNLMEQSLIVLSQLTMLVIDEADKMADESLGPQIDSILSTVFAQYPSSEERDQSKSKNDRFPRNHFNNHSNVDDRSNSNGRSNSNDRSNSNGRSNSTRTAFDLAQRPRLMMVSATMPAMVLPHVEKYMEKKVVVKVGRVGDVAATVRQVVHYVEMKDKKRRLVEELHGMEHPTIVFCNTRDTTEDVASLLGYAGFRVASLTGGKGQREREDVITGITEGILDIVVATDVLARGIDIDNVKNVINFEMPGTISQYVHRIGRTGRMGQKGVATSFVTANDEAIMYDLRTMLERNHFAVPEGLARNEASQTKKIISAGDLPQIE